MKKLLLASIIMFGVCSFANAQTAVADKKAEAKKNAASPNATLTPQKAAVTATTTLTTNADGTVTATESKTAVTTAERTDADRAKKMEAAKAAEKAPAVKKTKAN